MGKHRGLSSCQTVCVVSVRYAHFSPCVCGLRKQPLTAAYPQNWKAAGKFWMYIQEITFFGQVWRWTKSQTKQVFQTLILFNKLMVNNRWDFDGASREDRTEHPFGPVGTEKLGSELCTFLIWNAGPGDEVKGLFYSYLPVGDKHHWDTEVETEHTTTQYQSYEPDCQ